MVNRKRIIEEFSKLVGIDSLSYQEREMADLLKSYLVEMGFTVIEDNAGEYYQGNCGNLYAFKKGTIPGDPILLSAHMDTVTPGIGKKAVLEDNGKITSDGSTILGADDLSGVVSILEAVRTIIEQQLPHRNIEILFTIAEEVYLRGSEVFDYSVIKAKEAYVLDLDGEIGTAALSAPTVISFEAKITGRASHAGFAPEKGINAIAIAAEAITKIKQGRIDEETTANIGMIEGGKARNIVSEECVLRGEVRSRKHEKALAEMEKIKQIFVSCADKGKAKLEFETDFACIAYQVQKEAPVVERFEKVCQGLNIETNYIDTFGGSDNNNFHRHQINGLVISCGMHEVHSCKEYTQVEELVNCSTLVLKLLTD